MEVIDYAKIQDDAIGSIWHSVGATFVPMMCLWCVMLIVSCLIRWHNSALSDGKASMLDAPDASAVRLVEPSKPVDGWYIVRLVGIGFGTLAALVAAFTQNWVVAAWFAANVTFACGGLKK